MRAQPRATSHRIVLDLQISAAPIRGLVTDGPLETKFTGWIGLLAALEEAISRHPAIKAQPNAMR